MHRVLIDSNRTVPRRCFGLWTRRGAMALDLLIKNGTVVDGSGMPRYRADVGVRAGRIVEIGRIRSGAEKVIDADGLIVAPGFIDGHTHMDAQIAWDPLGSCSCWHGVTSVVMGNCGFALAPCKPEDREWFARCLTAVEDIPTEAMLAGIDWNWESFPEYLANVERLPKGLNYGMYIGHSALRMYVMGRRGLDEHATEDDLHRMEAAVAEAVGAGALGFSTSRATTHITPDGTPVASRIAEWQAIDGLPAWKEIRALPLAEQKRRLADPGVRRRLIDDEARMRPKGSELQGGGAATTDPRKPDYANLFPMLDVDWDDPSVAELARQQNKHPVEVMIDLALENDDRVFVQPLVNEAKEDVLGLL